MSLTTDPNDPALGKDRGDGQNEKYLVLSEEERAKGFVRPVRFSYYHVGIRPKYPTRPLTAEEKELYEAFGYEAYEEYPPEEEPAVGRYWTKEELSSGCGQRTEMARALAETYARDPSFYGATYCATCGKHFRVGAKGEFMWSGTTEKVGT